ncbi:hypothetical protein ACH5RR_023884 [Cinchona calisaya]|uniref:Ycf20-like protein n=1 Tax=Cinchona calisaya TaxID=153742 RepID=A0ABD2ZF17_9GENT
MIADKILPTGYPTSFKLHTRRNPRSRSPALFPGVCFNKTAFSHHFPPFHLAHPSLFNSFKRWGWSIRSAADGDRLNSSPIDDGSSGTRLIRAIQAIRVKLDTRIRELRKNFPMKLFSFLVGFYSATAFATVIGQTGDWDILSAALAVAVVEGIGALMYKASLPLIGKGPPNAATLKTTRQVIAHYSTCLALDPPPDRVYLKDDYLPSVSSARSIFLIYESSLAEIWDPMGFILNLHAENAV